MSALLDFGNSASEPAIVIARGVLGARVECTHKDLNLINNALLAAGLPISEAYAGDSSETAVHVGELVAGRNLQESPAGRLQALRNRLEQQLAQSVTKSVATFRPDVLGGPGAAGRNLARERASQGRDLLKSRIARVTDELNRRSA